MISEAAIAELKLRCPCDQVAGEWVKLRRRGKKFIGPCPLHSADPNARDSTSFECDADGWVCAVCHNGGDVLKLVALYHGLDPKVDFPRAVELLGGVTEPSAERSAELERERKLRVDKRERETNEFRERERRAAFDLWHAGVDWRGTPVEDYLRGPRGIATLPERMPLRFAPTVAFFHGEVENEVGRKSPRVIHRGPAMLAPIVDAAGKFRAVHITWLDLQRPNGKALITDPDDGETLDPKKVRGSKAGNVIRLVEPASVSPPANPTRSPAIDETTESSADLLPGTLYAGEGIETVLSVYAALAGAGRDLSRAWFRSTVDLGNLAGKAAGSVRHPALKDKAGRARRVPGPQPDPADKGFWLPDTAADVVLLGDGDSDAFTTACALRRACLRLEAAGRTARAAWAVSGWDFNDQLRDGAAAVIIAAIDAAHVPPAPADSPQIGGESEIDRAEKSPAARPAAEIKTLVPPGGSFLKAGELQKLGIATPPATKPEGAAPLKVVAGKDYEFTKDGPDEAEPGTDGKPKRKKKKARGRCRRGRHRTAGAARLRLFG